MENRLVNWQDGMLVSAERMQMSEDYYLEYSTLLAGYIKDEFCWGLAGQMRSESLIKVYESSSGKLFLSLMSSEFLSSNGLMLSVPDNETLDYVTMQHKENSGCEKFAVILSGVPHERVAYGELDSNEEPPRVPWSRIRLRLMIVPFAEIDKINGFSTVVGVLKQSSGSWAADTNYVVPVLKIKYLKVLTEWFDNIAMMYDRIIKLSFQLVEKINIRGKGYSLAANIHELSVIIMNLFEINRFQLVSVKYNFSPYGLRLFFSRICGAITAFLKKITTEQKREMLDYINEWCLIPPGIFQQAFDAVLEPDFRQWNISQSMFKIQDMLRTLVVVWEKLNQLEFVGQHKENIVIS